MVRRKIRLSGRTLFLNINIKEKTTLAIALAFLSLIVSAGTLLYTSFIAFPKAELIITNPNIHFDSRALSDSTFIDSLFVSFNVYNKGFKDAPINSVRINISDPEYEELFLFQTKIKEPQYIEFGKIDKFIYKIKPIIITPKSVTPYQISKKVSFREWSEVFQDLSPIIRGVPIFQMSRQINLQITLNYVDGEIEHIRKTDGLIPLYPSQ